MTIQSGILLEGTKAAIYLEAKITDVLKVPTAVRQFLASLKDLQQKFPESQLGAVIAFGDEVWKKLQKSPSAAELKPFKLLGKGEFQAPATQQDLLIHIQSQRPDVNFTTAQMAVKAFDKAINVAQEIHGFRWVEDRDLTGFIDGTENPKGENREIVGIIAEGNDIDGSYIFTQRWEHQLPKWEKLSVEKQEQVIGRTKKDSVELDEVPETSHVGRTDVKENGKGLKILRQSLPYGTASGTNGLFFIAYCATLHNIEQQLLSMFGEKDGKTDRILGFTQPVTGSYYFAPSVEQLLAL